MSTALSALHISPLAQEINMGAMIKESQGLSEAQQLAVQMVVTGKPGVAIAKALEITPETVSRWRQLPEFQAAVNALLLDARDSMRERMRGMCTLALDTVEASLQDPELSKKDKITAAFKVLELCSVKDVTSSKIGSPYAIDLQDKNSLDFLMLY
jgi:hypothetical protein